MNESVNDIAKKLGIVKFSFKEIFILPDSEKERVEQLAEKGICTDVVLLREHLEYAGKRCCVYESLVEYHEKTIADTQQKIKKDRFGSYALEKWLPILQTHRNIYELMGYLTLLQMDAITTTIALLQAQNDTERIMLSKHAYTIIYEARINDLSKKVAKEMHLYLDEIIDVHELSDFWKNINSILKQIMDIDFAKEIRNNIDAHKNNSFLRQITLYRRCKWVECIIYLSVFTKLIDVIQDYMNLINKNMKNMYEQYTEDVKGFIERLEQIEKELKK
jgi:predicted DNA-binding protein